MDMERKGQGAHLASSPFLSLSLSWATLILVYYYSAWWPGRVARTTQILSNKSYPPILVKSILFIPNITWRPPTPNALKKRRDSLIKTTILSHPSTPHRITLPSSQRIQIQNYQFTTTMPLLSKHLHCWNLML